jgi:CheY-like chemotaxis protein
LKICLVDDDEDVRHLMERMLNNAGVRQVKCFSGGREALDYLGSEALPDLVILDQNMPEMNGARAMALIRERYPEMPILISSGQPDIDEWDCFKLPGVGVISKPFNMEEIRAKLAQFAG